MIQRLRNDWSQADIDLLHMDSLTGSSAETQTAEARPQPIQEMVAEALRLHREGRLADAEQMYRQILSVDPHQPDSLHLLGMIAFENGDKQTAVDLIRKAIEIKGNAASYTRTWAMCCSLKASWPGLERAFSAHLC